MNLRDIFDTVQEHAASGVDTAADAAADGKTTLLKALADAGKLLGSLSPVGVAQRMLPRAAPSLASSLLTFGAGAAVGAVAGVLLAPQSGEQTRAMLRQRLDELLARGRAGSDDLRDDVASAVDQARSQAHDAVDQAKDTAHHAAEQTKDAAQRLADQAKDATQRVVDQTKDAAQRVVEQGKDLAQDVRAGASHLGKAPNSAA